MSETIEKVAPQMFGRSEIQTSVEFIDDTNVVDVISDSYVKHLVNRGQIDYLYNYYKGKQPILSRVKEVRPEICNTIVENRANAIVTFRVGYTVGKPIQYISSVSDEFVSQSVARLNDLMRISGKPSKDKMLVEWMMICGTGYRMVLPKEEAGNGPAEFDIWTLDPRNAFVVYQNDVGHTPLAGVYYTVDDNQNVTFHVYTDTMFYKINGWNSGEIVETRFNPVGKIPIIEYPLNMSRLGAFEIVLPMLDALNNLESNRMDSIEQFVQSLLVAINCEFDEDVTANQIRQAGMVVLSSIGENKADIKIISQSLDQSQTQTLKKSLLDAINQIAGIPSQGDGSTGDSSNNGAIVLKNGWQGAETKAQDFEMMFREPEQRTLEIVTKISSGLSDLDLDPADVDIKFTRRNYEDILSKSQTLITMLNNDKIHPQCAYEASGLFIDVQEAYNMGMDWFRQMTEQYEKEAEAEAEAEAAALEAENETAEEEEPAEETEEES